MTATVVADCSSVFGRTPARLSVVALALGIAALLVSSIDGTTTETLGALAASWLFFAGLAAGGVAVSAAIRSSHGRWAEGALPFVEATAAFFPAAWFLLAIIVLGARTWIPGASTAGWVEWGARSARDLLASAVLFIVGARYVAPAARTDGESREGRTAIAYLLLYAATLSLWAVDLVMGLHDWAPSTVIPPFYFMGAFLAALAWAALIVALLGDDARDSRTRHDLGKLLFAFVIMWGYLLWSAYLPVWYGNMPDETGQLLARWDGGWKFLSIAVLASVLAFPFLFLIPERTKRNHVTLAITASVILGGLLGERFLLVLPSLTLGGGWPAAFEGVAVTLGVAGLFVLTVGARLSNQRSA